MSTDPVITGDTIRNARAEAGMTQAEAAIAWNISRKTVFNWEARGSDPLPARAQDRARHLLDRLAGGPARYRTGAIAGEADTEWMVDRMVASQLRLRDSLRDQGSTVAVRHILSAFKDLEAAASFVEALPRFDSPVATINRVATALMDSFLDSGLMQFLMPIPEVRERVFSVLEQLGDLAVITEEGARELREEALRAVSQADVTLAASDADIDAEVEAQQEEP